MVDRCACSRDTLPRTRNLVINYRQHGHLGIVMVSGQLNLVCLLVYFVILVAWLPS